MKTLAFVLMMVVFALYNAAPSAINHERNATRAASALMALMEAGNPRPCDLGALLGEAESPRRDKWDNNGDKIEDYLFRIGESRNAEDPQQNDVAGYGVRYRNGKLSSGYAIIRHFTQRGLSLEKEREIYVKAFAKRFKSPAISSAALREIMAAVEANSGTIANQWMYNYFVPLSSGAVHRVVCRVRRFDSPTQLLSTDPWNLAMRNQFQRLWLNHKEQTAYILFFQFGEKGK